MSSAKWKIQRWPSGGFEPEINGVSGTWLDFFEMLLTLSSCVCASLDLMGVRWPLGAPRAPYFLAPVEEGGGGNLLLPQTLKRVPELLSDCPKL